MEQVDIDQVQSSVKNTHKHGGNMVICGRWRLEAGNTVITLKPDI